MRSDAATSRAISDGAGNSVQIEPVAPDKMIAYVRIDLTKDNFHVLEYVLNNMVGLEQQERMGFKMDTARELGV